MNAKMKTKTNAKMNTNTNANGNTKSEYEKMKCKAIWSQSCCRNGCPRFKSGCHKMLQSQSPQFAVGHRPPQQASATIRKVDCCGSFGHFHLTKSKPLHRHADHEIVTSPKQRESRPRGLTELMADTASKLFKHPSWHAKHAWQFALSCYSRTGTTIRNFHKAQVALGLPPISIR